MRSILTFAVLFASVAIPAHAQGPRVTLESAALTAPVLVQVATDYEEGFRAGTASGEEVSTAGRMMGGVAWGLGLGILGIPLAYATVGDPDVPTAEFARISDRTSEYQRGYADGYSQRLKKRKQGAALGGSIAGTAIWLLIVVAANSGS